MKKIIIIFFILILVFMYTGEIICYAAEVTKSIKKGNIMYKKGKFDEALKYYNKAKIDAPGSAIVDFNIGAALYKKKEYKKAIDSFTNALSSSDSRIESRINYNIANAKYRIGRKNVNTNLQEAINLYRQALDYYKRSIRLNPHDMNAKYNHEFVERELKELLDKLKHQKSSSKGKKGTRNRNSEKKSKTSLSNKENSKKNKNTTSESGQKNKEEAKKEKTNPNKIQQLKTGGQKGLDNKEMSEKEARMILDRYNQEELPRSFINKKQSFGYPQVDKDW